MKKQSVFLSILPLITTIDTVTTTTTTTTASKYENHSSSSQTWFIKPFQLTFTQGFIVGQLSFLILLLGFVRYMVFENPKSDQPKPIDPHRKPLQHSPVRRSNKKPRRLSILDKSHPTLESDLLSKLTYDLSTHPPETTDWLNVLLAQAIIAYRSLVQGLDDDPTMPKGNKAKQMVEEAMNFARGESPGIISVDYITVTEVEFGKEYPVCTNARVRPADETGRMRIEIDIDYSDHVTLAIETKVVVNFPTARFAVLPISLGLTLKQLSATIMTEIPPIAIPLPMNADPSAPSPAVLMSLDPDFTLSMSTTSLLGSIAKLQDLPKIEQLILGRLRAWIVDNLVWPKVRVLKLPGLGKKGSVEDSADGEGEYVWVEGTTPDKPSSPGKDPKLPKSVIREADEDEGPTPSPASCDTPGGMIHPTLIPLQNKSLSSKYYYNLRSVSRHPTSEHDGFIPPNRQRRPSNRTDYRPQTHQPPPESDGYSNHPKPPGAIPSSDRSILSPRHHNKNTSSSPPPLPLAPNSRFQTSTDHQNTWPQKHLLPRNSGNLSPNPTRTRSIPTHGDQVGWARAGGMTGVPMGLGSPVPNLGFGIRERIRDVERIESLRNTSADHDEIQR